jgi:Mg2+-importing ATPase
MLTFGLVSSVFDYLTFGALLLVANATEVQFRSGWFVESVVSASLIVLVVRTRRPLHQSRPSRQLLTATLAIVAGAVAVPYSPLASLVGLAPLPITMLLMIVLVVMLYVVTAEIAKRIFYRFVPS